ncbi:PfkB domain-containing protein [Anopheles sinensis]|uniref:PfkB domain-containing protein n=1 Tax=Anopheles sinensis TaxID=74873 RepID=A0A084VNA4_ANOSI|nr:PfkB domain-containing protein [Anopheles sinensis]
MFCFGAPDRLQISFHGDTGQRPAKKGGGGMTEVGGARLKYGQTYTYISHVGGATEGCGFNRTLEEEKEIDKE